MRPIAGEDSVHILNSAVLFTLKKKAKKNKSYSYSAGYFTKAETIFLQLMKQMGR